eukprot:6212620-Pleurochrysis_carterae.AAC.3
MHACRETLASGACMPQAEFEAKKAGAANLDAAEQKNAEILGDVPVAIDATEVIETADPGWLGKNAGAAYTNTKKFLTKGVTIDVHKSVETNKRVQAIHENAEKFDPMTEAVFRYVQVFTAICVSFAHGANDTANAMGPFMAIYVIYTTGKVSKKSDVGDDAYWILAIGGAGIDNQSRQMGNSVLGKNKADAPISLLPFYIIMILHKSVSTAAVLCFCTCSTSTAAPCRPVYSPSNLTESLQLIDFAHV